MHVSSTITSVWRCAVQDERLLFDRKFMADRIDILVAGEPKEFAWRVGISLSAVYNYLRGRPPVIAVLIRIAVVYGRDLNWFFCEFQPKQLTTAPPADGHVERRLELVRRPKQATTV